MFTVFLTYFWQTSAETLTSLLSCVWLTGCCWLSVRCTVHLISARGDRGKHSRKEEFPSTPYTTFTSTESESDGATEEEKKQKHIQKFIKCSEIYIKWTTSINTQTQNINYHFLHCNNQYCHKCVWEAEKAAVTPTTCRVRRAPACSTEQSDWRTKCFITYLYSQFIFVLQTFRDVQEYKKKSIYN